MSVDSPPGRVVAEARCRRRGHLLAELLVTVEGTRTVWVPVHAAIRAKGDRLVRAEGGPVHEPLADGTTDYLPYCEPCGVTYRVPGADLARHEGGSPVIADVLR